MSDRYEAVDDLVLLIDYKDLEARARAIDVEIERILGGAGTDTTLSLAELLKIKISTRSEIEQLKSRVTMIKLKRE